MLVRCYKENKPVIAFDKLNKSDWSEVYIFCCSQWHFSGKYVIVFSELTCINSDCSIWGQLWRVDGDGLTMFLESLLLNSWVTVTLTSYYLVRMPRKKQKKELCRKEKLQKKKQEAVIYIWNGLTFISMEREPWMFFWGTGVHAI